MEDRDGSTMMGPVMLSKDTTDSVVLTCSVQRARGSL